MSARPARLSKVAIGLSGLAIALWIPAAVALLRPAPAEVIPAGEARTPLPVLPAEREVIREVMRENLRALHGIQAALGRGDAAAAAALAREAAEAPGPGRRAPGLRERLPEGWLSLGKQVHRGYRALARDLEGGASERSALEGLAEVSAACVSCHASFRLVTSGSHPGED